MKFQVDTGDGVSGTGGTGGGPAVLARQYVYVTWAWPSNVANPAGFEVVAYTGTDPTATNAYIFPPQKCMGNDRALQKQMATTVSLTNINASVRAIYA